MRRLLVPTRPALVLAVVDAVALVAFALVGAASHHALTVTGFARDALPLLAGWFGVALLAGAYRRRAARLLLLTWLLGVPLGVAVRALVLGRPANGREAAFLAVSLTFTLLFVAAGRLVLSLGSVRPVLD